jgi:hypothetical protein
LPLSPLARHHPLDPAGARGTHHLDHVPFSFAYHPQTGQAMLM